MDLENVVVRACEQLFAYSGPFLADVGEFGFLRSEAKIPAGPFALKHAQFVSGVVEYSKSAADGEKFLAEPADRFAVLVRDLNFRNEERYSSMNADDRLPFRSSNLDVEGRRPLEIGKAQDFCEQTEFLFTALEDQISGFRIEDVEIVRRLEKADVFLNEVEIVVKNRVHFPSIPEDG